ncbi:cyclic-di-AMP receptor [Anaerosalibacter bizertensis]|uniref:Cyclic-di-AMP receptor n=1 Tax=Anaerosalibacter bizertensis TaxID=932217 RepID=A0A9Q4ACW1_9FIRM|nr:cyclic-di-AMP receptor [Anaerosalibacter bizertensis]MBV1819470.1 cyclic-di-AMP receptor [Bacteroidales bacterium MSK.15.36]HHV27076.1 hypothetical protein [Tissierellia bacterium]MCB5560312.1 cyclic-di-AMP receptor [Anaerosalibacter bizertensis]MCG4565301.1 cyclic-di-AMP receptor [Anaerosalibacter bizertensis]MCG4582171.1 cyclic-di-AMP receptor [Anaerosalibacter bizertensis]
MKLIISIVQDKDVAKVVKALMDKKYRVTKLASTGGFLKAGNTTLLIGVEDEKVDEVIDTIKALCNGTKVDNGSKDVEVGGATIFVIDTDEFRRI